VAVNPETAYYDTLQRLRESDFPFIVQEVPGASTEMLINAVANGEYDLINDFAKKHRLRVSVVVRDSPSAMFAALEAGEGDVIAASMTITEDRQRQGWMFSDRYLEVNEQLIGRADESPLENIGQLAGRTVAVNPETAYYDTLQRLRESDFPFIVQEVPGASTEMLINAVANGEYDLT